MDIIKQKLNELKDEFSPYDENFGLIPDDIEWLIRTIEEQEKEIKELTGDNNWLYGRLNLISDVIEQGRIEKNRK